MAAKSPLLFPVTIKEKSILVLDETKLPFKEEYMEITSLDQAVQVVKEMKTRSLGQVLLCVYSCAVFHDKGSIDFICKRFKDARPTFDFLMIGEIMKGQVGNGLSVKDAGDSFVRMFDTARRRRAQQLADILPRPANILTICNVNGELLYLYEELLKVEKPSFFYVCETRPYLQGTRLTFWELRQNNIPARILCDCQAAAVLRDKKVDCVVTGADRATTGGDIINKTGTYALARLAKHYGVPFYPLTQYPRDMNIDMIEIEERPTSEAFMFLGGNFSYIDAAYPSFDVTKREYVTRCVELPQMKMLGER